MEYSLIVEGVLEILSRGGYVLIPIFIIAQIGWIFIIERYFYLHSLKSNSIQFWKKAPITSNEFIEFAKIQGKSLNGLEGTLIRELSQLNIKEEKGLSNKAQEVLTDFTNKMERHFNTIGIMANSAPLLGLLGTVAGMVATFQIITEFGIGNPAMMATGISQALLTTQAGLVVSFPLILLHNFLHNKADHIESQALSSAARTINILRSSN